MGLRRLLLFCLLANMLFFASAQTGTIEGTVIDVKTNETLIGATIFLEGTTLGTITDFDGNYVLDKVPAGIYHVRCSFISYETKNIENVKIEAGGVEEIHFVLNESTIEIGDVRVVAKANRESEAMLLLDQKEASGIKESIGSNRMSSMGISDAASATSKISGVTKNESSGDVYIRGLGDRYLTTTMNGLPIPSDDVEKKNIDLNLFSADVIENVGIDKTFSVESYADQSSGTVNISSKTFNSKVSVGLSAKANTNVLKDGLWNDFKTTQNMNDVSFGFYDRPYATPDAVKYQSWNTETTKFPLGYGLSFTGGKKFKLFDNDFSVFATMEHENASEHQKGIYQKYRSNVLNDSFTDAETFQTKINSTGLLNLAYDFSEDHSLNFNSLLVFKTTDQLYEAGRNGEGYIYDQLPQDSAAFIRDQNLKITQLYVNQLLGTHTLSDNNTLKWAVAYNIVNSDEPNRIRNQVHTVAENEVRFAYVGDFQQRKSHQFIEDSEINGFLNDELRLINEDQKKLKLNYGGNFRMKKRDFESLFVGVRAKNAQISSIDNLDEAFLDLSKYNTRELVLREAKPDLYNADLNVYAGYLNADFSMDKLSGTVGARYEMDQIDVQWDVANYVGRTGSISNDYTNILPALNFKYQLSEKSSLRLAASKTITLPEFKELSPFEYVSPTGRVTKGNPDLQHSENYNLDLKWELFPSSKELVSLTGFYKQINDPINLAQTRGSSGNFIYENTGERADVYGFEFETRLSLLEPDNSAMPELNLILNATKMWFNQDLLEEFQYNNVTETGLQGASDFILNGTLSFSDNKENEFVATLTGNYSSDKILALGAPEDFQNSATLFNNEIIEKGFAAVDLVISKKLSKAIALKLSGKNLLNPKLEQTQDIKPLNGDPYTATVSSYRKGIELSLGLKINLNSN